MQNTLTIRYKFIHKLVNDLYISLGLNSYPIDLNTVVNSFSNIKIISYSQFMNDFNLTKTQVFSYFTSDDGCCDYKPSLNAYIIYYNDITITNPRRILWTIVHELGHIFCRHNNINSMVESDDDLYDFMESEANYFTSIFLAHPAILKELNIHNPYEIEVFCNLSTQAAKYRYSRFKRFTTFRFLTGSDKYIIANFRDFIDSKNKDYYEHLNFLSAFQGNFF